MHTCISHSMMINICICSICIVICVRMYKQLKSFAITELSCDGPSKGLPLKVIPSRTSVTASLGFFSLVVLCNGTAFRRTHAPYWSMHSINPLSLFSSATCKARTNLFSSASTTPWTQGWNQKRQESPNDLASGWRLQFYYWSWRPRPAWPHLQLRLFVEEVAQATHCRSKEPPRSCSPHSQEKAMAHHPCFTRPSTLGWWISVVQYDH